MAAGKNRSLHKYAICLILSFIPIITFSQLRYSPDDFWNRIRYGGGLGLGFGNNTFNASVAPSAIYQADEHIALGLGLSFNYSKYREYKLTAYGASLLALYNPINAIQLSAEPEQLRVNRRLDIPGGVLETNYWSPALFLGVGYSNGNVTVGIRYDVLYKEDKSIYADAWMPFVRVYF